MSFEWQHFFDTIAEEDIIWDMTETSTYVTLDRKERELLLVGAWAFVVYPICRCSCMLGNFRIPPVSFYPQVDYHLLNSRGDLLRLKEILMNWEFNRLDHLKVMNDSGDKAKYFEWLLPKLLPIRLSAEAHEAKHLKEDEY